MKLRNKKTGESYETTMPIVFNIKTSGGGEHTVSCESIKELNEKWGDVPEEPKEYWAIDCFSTDGNIVSKFTGGSDITIENRKSIGDYFETEEEAEKAVEKLKAWKRLKDKGFRFNGWEIDQKKHLGVITIKTEPYYSFEFEDLDLLFGGEE